MSEIDAQSTGAQPAGSPETGGSKWSRRAQLLAGPVILAAVMLVFTVLAMHSGTSFPASKPQERCAWDSLLDAVGRHKEALCILLSLLAGLYACLHIRPFVASRIWTGVFALLIPPLSFLLTEAYNRGYWHVGAPLSYKIAEPMSSMFLLNLLLYYLFYLFLAFLLGSLKRGYTAASIVLMAVAIANYYVVSFRGSPIVPWDLLSIRTAGNVAGNYAYTISWQMLLASFGYLFLILTSLKMGPIWPVCSYLPVRIGAAALSLIALVVLVAGLQKEENKSFWGIDTTLFTPNVRYTKNGFWPAFLSNLSFLNVEKPDGYSVSRAREIADEAEAAYEESLKEKKKAQRGTGKAEKSSESGKADNTSAVSSKSDAKRAGAGKADSTGGDFVETEQTESPMDGNTNVKNPNIIVILNEAFSDLSVLGEVQTSEDYIPRFRSLMEDYTSGYMMVSVKGGNTANTEYESISSDTMAYLPPGSVVFQQYISDAVPTMASDLKAQGYTTIGMHPYLGSGWERDRVYPLMGFDRFLDEKDFAGADKLRGYVSDRGAYNKVIDLFLSKEKDERQLIYLVTMQNHSGYTPKATDNGFSEEIYLTDAPAQTPDVVAAERYLTLLKYSDDAFGDLIGWFEENVTEPTVIVMFGDHEPGDYITNVIDQLAGNESFSTASDNSGASTETQQSLEDVQKHYMVPYIIWNNFGAQKREDTDLISANYLAPLVMEEAQLDLSPYQMFLLEMRKQVPALAAGAYVDSDGVFHSWAEADADEERSEILNNYHILQYNHLNDVRNRQEDIFEPAS